METEKSSLSVVPGKTITVPVELARGKGLQGAARLELIVPSHIRGITADAVTPAAGKLVEMLERGAHRDRVRVPGVIDQKPAAR